MMTQTMPAVCSSMVNPLMPESLLRAGTGICHYTHVTNVTRLGTHTSSHVRFRGEACSKGDEREGARETRRQRRGVISRSTGY